MEPNNQLIELVENKNILNETVFANVNINETAKTNMSELISTENKSLEG